MKRRTKNKLMTNSNLVIGAETTCSGGNKYIKGKRIVIVAVWKGALKPGFNPDADDAYIRDDETLKKFGGLEATDEVEVETCERWQRSVSQGIVKATELELFAKRKRRELFDYQTNHRKGEN